MATTTFPDHPGELSIAVIEAVATQAGVSPTDLPPLYSCIDPDGLEYLFQASSNEMACPNRVEFGYAGCFVSITYGDEYVVTVTSV